MKPARAAMPHTRRYRPITRRFAQWVIGLTLGLLLAHGALESLFAYRESLDHIKRLQAVQAEAAALEIASYVQQLHGGLQRVAGQPWGLAGFGPEQQREEFHQLMRAHPAITAFAAIRSGVASPLRGGIAAIMNELCAKHKVGMLIDEERIPVKHEVRKYIKRERSRALPEGVDFWDFDCQFGLSADTAESVHLANLITSIDSAAKAQAQQVYVVVLATR